jgi:hypothetical protein
VCVDLLRAAVGFDHFRAQKSFKIIFGAFVENLQSALAKYDVKASALHAPVRGIQSGGLRRKRVPNGCAANVHTYPEQVVQPGVDGWSRDSGGGQKYDPVDLTRGQVQPIQAIFCRSH